MPRLPARHAIWFGLVGLLLLAGLACLPGLHGGFVFDDFVNLDALGKTGKVDDWAAFWRYVTSGNADPTGRPLALLSFLLDARDWPADPWPFLRTNLLLHLANAALLFALLRQLGRRLDGASPRTDAAALFGAGLWSLHPLFVSTTLYIVQREAMLSTTFVLLGLLAWGHGRERIARAPRSGMAWMLGGIGIGTLLAMLCKANGVLLPLLAWVLDACVFRRDGETPLARRLRWLLLALPGLLACGYVLSRLAAWSQPLEARPWTIGERVLTEPRVLLDYLRLLLVPRVLSTGVYNDDYLVSRSLLEPASTLPALLVVAALLAAGFAFRRRAPAFAAALLFFFAGHLLESTTIPLELYYEHRNYLPALLLGWPLARALVRWRAPTAVRAAIAAMVLAALAATTWQRAALWADQPRMAALWVAANPGSSRAVSTQALFDVQSGRPDLAMAVLALPWQRRPHDLQLAMNYIDAACMTQGPTGPDKRAVERALRGTPGSGRLVFNWLGGMLDAVQAGRCPGVGVGQVEDWTRAALRNPAVARTPGRVQDLHAILGRAAMARGDAGSALREFRVALDAAPDPDAAAQLSALLASHGHPAEGIALLDHYDTIPPPAGTSREWNMPRLHRWVLGWQGYWPRQFAELRRKMRDDLAAQGRASP